MFLERIRKVSSKVLQSSLYSSDLKPFAWEALPIFSISLGVGKKWLLNLVGVDLTYGIILFWVKRSSVSGKLDNSRFWMVEIGEGRLFNYLEKNSDLGICFF